MKSLCFQVAIIKAEAHKMLHRTDPNPEDLNYHWLTTDPRCSPANEPGALHVSVFHLSTSTVTAFLISSTTFRKLILYLHLLILATCLFSGVWFLNMLCVCVRLPALFCIYCWLQAGCSSDGSLQQSLWHLSPASSPLSKRLRDRFMMFCLHS